MFRRMKQKLKRDRKPNQHEQPAPSATHVDSSEFANSSMQSPYTEDEDTLNMVGPDGKPLSPAMVQLITQVRRNDEEYRKMQHPGETLEQTKLRMLEEMIHHSKDLKPGPTPPADNSDRIMDLLLHGHSDKPKTDGTSPNATMHERSMALVEGALENLWEPKPAPTHQITEIDPAGLGLYEYTPLPESRSIRLLHFHEDEFQLPEFGKNQKICTLETFPLDQAPPYLTLSYSWEGPKNDEESLREYKEPQDWFIRNDEDRVCRLSIGRNLYEGLNRIVAEFTSSRYIWIDALCINQDDTDERGSQVAMMGDVYSLCAKVIIWLGVMNPNDAGKIWDLHFQIVPEIPKWINRYGVDSLNTGDWTEEDLQQRFNISPISLRPELWNAYARFFVQTRWFYRAWVVQEVALSPSATVLFGHLHLPWQEMVLMCRFLSMTGLRNEVFAEIDFSALDDCSMQPGTVFAVFNRLLQFAVALKTPGTEETLAKSLGLTDSYYNSRAVFTECINTLRALQSTNPRDRVYAALGFLQIDKAMAGLIVPDYKISTELAFLKVAETLVEELPGLELLAMREDDGRRTDWDEIDMPSWVPDFTVPKAVLLQKEDTTAVARNPPFFSFNNGWIILRGVVLDKITKVHPWGLNIDQIEPSARMLDMLRVWFNPVIPLIYESPYNEDALEVLWRTLLANNINTPGEPPIDSSHFRAFVALTAVDMADTLFAQSNGKTVIQPTVVTGTFRASESKPTAEFLTSIQQAKLRVRTSLYPAAEDLEFLGSLHKKSKVFIAAVMKYNTNRQLYQTESGLVGLGPRTAKEGDHIVHIIDSRLLFVMTRREDDLFQMVGETYVHGMCDEKGLADRKMKELYMDETIIIE